MATVPDLLTTALQHHRSGRTTEAEQGYRQILQQQADAIDALNLLGALVYQQGRFAEAVTYFEQVLRLQPNNADALNSMGVALRGTGDRAAAVGYYRQALTHKPNHPEVLSNLGNVLRELGELPEAIAVYQQAIAIKPNYPEAHSNLAAAFRDQGNLAQAVVHYRQAIALKPTYTEAYQKLGFVLQQQGNLDAAIACFQQAITLKPNEAEPYHLWGNVLQQQGSFAEATSQHQQAIVLKPDYPEAYHALGSALLRQTKLDAAIIHYRQALSLKPSYPEALNNLGNALQEQGKLAEAIVHYRQAIALRENFAEAHSNLGAALKEQRLYEEAIAHLRQAVALRPDYAEVHNNLGNALQEQGNVEEAIACYETALQIKPDYAEIHSNLGNMLQQLGKFEAAFDRFRQALALQPDYAGAYNNLGIAYRNCNRIDESFTAYEQAIALNPEFVEAHWNKALTQLLLGDLAAGFAGYECRFEWTRFQQQNAARAYTQPRWDGSPLAGRTIFLYTEQGLGDTIQFIRYAAIVAQLGGKVILECQPPLLNLLQPLPSLHQVIPSGATPPAFDLHAPLMSLPHLLGTTLTTIPNIVPYLPHPAPRTPHPALQTPAYKIGIVWTGNAQNPYNLTRTCPIAHLLTLTKFPGVQLYSLQKEAPPEDFDRLQACPAVQDLRSHLDDFVDTARLIQQLDLVISIDTAIAHLAGALGKPVWLLLPFAPDWRWMRDRADSPWYPTMRIFRQPAYGDWERVMAEVRAAIVQQTSINPESLAPQPQDLTTPASVALNSLAMTPSQTLTASPNAPPTINQPPLLVSMNQSETLAVQLQDLIPVAPTVPSKLPIPAELKTAVRHYEAGRLNEAAQLGQELLRHHANHPKVWQLLGLIAHQEKRYDEAIAHYREVIHRDPQNHDTLNNLGVAFHEQGKVDEAIAYYQQALAANPNYADAHNNYANALRDKGQIESAIAHYQQAIALKPDYADAHNNLGLAFYAQERYEEAADAYRQAIVHRPNFAQAHNHLGNALKELGDSQQAALSYQQAIALKPDYAKAYNNWGNIFRDQADLATALSYYEQATAIDPNFAEAHWNKALTYLLGGDLQQGFAAYEWRWQVKLPTFRPMRIFPQPLWDGSDLAGQRIFLHAEQGMGDLIQFVRYAAIVAQKGGRVILEAHLPLIKLLQQLPHIEQIVPYATTPPDFDCHAPLLSLPHILGITQATIPNTVPYLPIPPSAQSLLPRSPNSKPQTLYKVGIVWTGNPQNSYNRTRTCPLAQLLRLTAIPDIAFYSLQKESTPTDLQLLRSHPKVTDLRDQLADFVDTAALIDQLDLVISIDSAVTHLAGALGKPVWLLLPFAPDWRWMLDRPDSPWYPTLRIFRQPSSGDWERVIAAVHTALSQRPLQSTPEPVLPAALPSRRRLSLAPSPFALLQAALQHYHSGDLAEAERVCRQLLQQDPDSVEGLHTLGVILCRQGYPAEAEAQLRRVIALQPDFADAWGNLGGALQQQGDFEAAIVHYQRAIALNPTFADAHQNLSIALQELDRLEEAVIHAQRAVDLKPDYAEGHYSLGFMLRRLGKVAAAIVHYRKAIHLRPDFVDAHKNLGHALLLTGDLLNGFAEYEWRWRQQHWFPRPLPQPLWDGSPLQGKTILLHAEQGYGDTLQFIRYAALVKAQGATVIFECPEPLLRLLQGTPGIDRLIPQDTPLPDFDLHAPLVSLPHLLRTTLDTIPATVPYLSTFPSSPLPHLPSAYKIGIVWTGNPEHKNNYHRSCPIAHFRSLAEIPGVQLFSLQKGDAAADLAANLAADPTLPIQDLSAQLTDFADTAAAIAQLDLVMTIDTSVAHLAGALGKPVWVLLSFAADWRWMLDRADSPWYPSARLFRQPQAGDWQSVFQQVQEALQPLVQESIAASKVNTIAAETIAPDMVAAETIALETIALETIALDWQLDLDSDLGILGVNLALQLQHSAIKPSVSIANLPPLYQARLQTLPRSLQSSNLILQAFDHPDAIAARPDCDRAIALIHTTETNFSKTAIAALQTFDRVITTSTWNAKILKGYGLEQVDIIPWGIDPSLFHPAPNAKLWRDRFVIFTGGDFSEANGSDLAIAAFQAFHSRHPEALLLTTWQPSSVNCNLSETAAIHLGQIPYSQLGQILRSTDVALCPNRCTPTGRLALESLACGIPTILSANTGHLELIQHNLGYPLQFQRPVSATDPGVTGWGESDVEEIVETLERVYRDRPESHHRAIAAADFLQTWTWEQQAQKVLDAIAATTSWRCLM
jgi:tetratricopeptide (TPR) repeat protein/glycosyltransferase involved in cell wall biosynthesis